MPILTVLAPGAADAAVDGAAEAPADDATRPDTAPHYPGLRVVQQGLSEAFTLGDPDRLAATLSQVMKTYVSSRPIDVGDGYYGADQMRLFSRKELAPLPFHAEDVSRARQGDAVRLVRP